MSMNSVQDLINIKLKGSHFSFHADLLKEQTPLDAFVLFWLFSNLQASYKTV